MSVQDDTLVRMLTAPDDAPHGAEVAATVRGTPVKPLAELPVVLSLRERIVELGELARRFGYEEVEVHVARALVALLNEADSRAVMCQTPQAAVVLPFKRG